METSAWKVFTTLSSEGDARESRRNGCGEKHWRHQVQTRVWSPGTHRPLAGCTLAASYGGNTRTPQDAAALASHALWSENLPSPKKLHKNVYSTCVHNNPSAPQRVKDEQIRGPNCGAPPGSRGHMDGVQGLC